MIERKVTLQVLLLALCVCAYQVAQAYKSPPPWNSIRHQRRFAVNAHPSENQADFFQGVRRIYARVCNPAELMVACSNFRRQCDRAVSHLVDRPHSVRRNPSREPNLALNCVFRARRRRSRRDQPHSGSS